nr:uncharacterized protein LOC127326467 [Lolium perenne]
MVEFLSALQGQMGVKASCLDHSLVCCAHYARRRRGEPINIAPACTHRHLRDLIEFVDLHWRAHHAAADGRSAIADVPVSLALGAVSIRSFGFVHLCLWPKPQEPGREKPSKIAFPQPPFLEGRPRSPLV